VIALTVAGSLAADARPMTSTPPLSTEPVSRPAPAAHRFTAPRVCEIRRHGGAAPAAIPSRH
jgi:hypothetical protein